MKHIVSFSGGRTSAYLCKLMIHKFGRDNVDFIFMDTGAEHPKTYEFVKNVNSAFGLNLVCLQAVVDPELGNGIRSKIIDVNSLCFNLKIMKELVSKHGNFTVGRPYCTARLKTQVFDHYCKNKYGKNGYQTWIGIRADEKRRLPKEVVDGVVASSHLKAKLKLNYMAQISDFDKNDVIDWWSAYKFDLDLPNTEHLGNCVFCVKKSEIKLALAQRDEPKLYDDWVDAISGSHVREMPADKFGTGHIYRQWASPDSIIAKFSIFETEELRNRINKSFGNYESACSESCEVFGDQMDMFKESI